MIKKILDKQIKENNNLLNEASAISEVKLLLDTNAMDDLHLLQKAFPNSTNSQIINENGEREQVRKLKNIHNGDIYTTEDIKSLCMKYRLRFLPSVLYKGNIPSELLSEMKRKFTEENKLSHLSTASSTIYDRNLFMLAPAYMFSMESYGTIKKRELSEAKRMRRLDPACFVKIEDDKYLFLKEWGNSFSILRRILGTITSKTKTLNRLFLLSWFAFLYMSYSIMALIAPFATKDKGEHLTIYALPLVLVFAATVVLSISWICPSETGFFMSYFKSRKDGWFKTDERLSTENNWNQRN